MLVGDSELPKVYSVIQGPGTAKTPAGKDSFWPHLWAAQLLSNCAVTRSLAVWKSLSLTQCPPVFLLPHPLGNVLGTYSLTRVRDFSSQNILVGCL